MNNCVFCQIVRGKSPAKIIFEDKEIMAIAAKKPVSRGHTVVIPKNHFQNIFDIDNETFIQFARVLKKLSGKLVKENKATGINILHASGKDAQQSVFHLHFHLVPRYPHDGLNMWIKQKL
jgi:histidine triad (HIT) family protein